jgi:hypothetical protein
MAALDNIKDKVSSVKKVVKDLSSITGKDGDVAKSVPIDSPKVPDVPKIEKPKLPKLPKIPLPKLPSVPKFQKKKLPDNPKKKK